MYISEVHHKSSTNPHRYRGVLGRTVEGSYLLGIDPSSVQLMVNSISHTINNHWTKKVGRARLSILPRSHACPSVQSIDADLASSKLSIHLDTF